jgi:hypothetical protein
MTKKEVETRHATSHNDEKNKKEASLRGRNAEANQKDSERWIASPAARNDEKGSRDVACNVSQRRTKEKSRSVIARRNAEAIYTAESQKSKGVA